MSEPGPLDLLQVPSISIAVLLWISPGLSPLFNGLVSGPTIRGNAVHIRVRVRVRVKFVEYCRVCVENDLG